jgi:hypothetical protein
MFQETGDEIFIYLAAVLVEQLQAEVETEQADAAGITPRFLPDGYDGVVGEKRPLSGIPAGGQQAILD